MRSLFLVTLLLAGLAQAYSQAASFRPTHYRGASWSYPPRAAVFRPVATQRRIEPAQRFSRQTGAAGPPAAVPRPAATSSSSVFRGSQRSAPSAALSSRFRPDPRAANQPAQPDPRWGMRSVAQFRPTTRFAGRVTQQAARYAPRSRPVYAPVVQSPAYRSPPEPAYVQQQAYASMRPPRVVGVYGGGYPSW